MDSVILFSDSSRGIYIPQHFATSVRRECVRGIDLADLDLLASDSATEREDYWDTWAGVLDYCEVVTPDGDVYTLHQDGDLWLLCLEKMTDEEKENFGFDRW